MCRTCHSILDSGHITRSGLEMRTSRSPTCTIAAAVLLIPRPSPGKPFKSFQCLFVSGYQAHRLVAIEHRVAPSKVQSTTSCRASSHTVPELLGQVNGGHLPTKVSVWERAVHVLLMSRSSSFPLPPRANAFHDFRQLDLLHGGRVVARRVLRDECANVLLGALRVFMGIGVAQMVQGCELL